MLLESTNYLHLMVVFYGVLESYIVPSAGRKRILDDLHETHQGASRMKARARMVVWWPGLDKSIEKLVSNCSACQASRPLPPSAPLVNSTEGMVQTLHISLYSQGIANNLYGKSSMLKVVAIVNRICFHVCCHLLHISKLKIAKYIFRSTNLLLRLYKLCSHYIQFTIHIKRV